MRNPLRATATLGVVLFLAPCLRAEEWEQLTTRVVLAAKQTTPCGLAKLPEKLKARRGSKVSWKLASSCAADEWVIVGNFVPADEPACKPASDAPSPVSTTCRPQQLRAGKQATLQCVIDPEAPVGCWRYDVMRADPGAPDDHSRWTTIADPEVEIRE